MSIVEAGARGGAISILVLLAALLVREGRGVRGARCAALFAMGLAATLVSYAPELAADQALWLAPFRILAFGNPAVFWVMASTLFDDDFEVSWRQPAAWLALDALGFWAIYGGEAARPFLPVNALSLICLALGLWPVLVGRAGDLVEARRRLRVAVVGGTGLVVVAVIVAVTVLHGGQGYPAFGYANAFGALAFSLAVAAALLSPTPGSLFEVRPAARAARLAAPPGPKDPRETALLSALRREMEEQRAYRDEGLSIGVLAHRLGVPEHRLRRLINQQLGHRNFAAFLNGYRLDEVMAWLSDPSQGDASILTLALDAGFQSIGPFNRAFKARTSRTPSDFRQRPPSRD